MGARALTGPVLDALESRQFLAAEVFGGELIVVGTHKADLIRLYVDPRHGDQMVVQVNAAISRFPIASISRINVVAGAGNDIVQLQGAAPHYAFPSRIYGCNGNDSIFSGAGPDRVYGGTGNDYIDAGYARDIVYGEWGDDSILGHQGNDYLCGDGGNDTIAGELGIDQHYGGDGNDFLDAEDGTFDRVDGGLGEDLARADSMLDSKFGIEQILF